MANELDLAAAQFMDVLRATPPSEWVEGTVQDLSRRMAVLRVAEELLAKVVRDVNDALVLQMEGDRRFVLGFGLLVKSPRDNTRWRHPESSQAMRLDLGRAVVQSIAMDIATGEIDHEKQNIARETVNRMYDVIPAFSSVKAAGRRYGIDLTDYRETTTTYRIELIPGEEES